MRFAAILESKRNWVIALPVVSLFALVVHQISLFNEKPSHISSSDVLLHIFILLVLLTGFCYLAWTSGGGTDRKDSSARLMVFFGSIFLLPSLVIIVYHFVFHDEKLPVWMDLTALIIAVASMISYLLAIRVGKSPKLRVIIRRGLQYALLSRAFLFVEGGGLFFLFFYLLGPLHSLLFNKMGAGVPALIAASATMGCVMVLRKINRVFMLSLDRRFFREAYDGKKILTELGGKLEHLSSEPDILVRTVVRRIGDSLHPSHVCIYLKKSEIEQMPSSVRREWLDPVSSIGIGNDDLVCVWRVKSTFDGSPRWGGCGDKVLPDSSDLARRIFKSCTEESPWLDVRFDSTGDVSNESERSPANADEELSEECGLLIKDTRLFVPIATREKFLGFLSLGEKKSEEPYVKEDKELLSAVAHQAALALVYAEFIRNEAERIKLNDDMAIARQVQERLFPQSWPSIDGLEYSGTCLPALGVGGDCFDFIDLENKRLGIALGDIAGKGVSAALLMASLQAMLRVHAHAHGDDVSRLFSDINELLCGMTDTNRFASFFYGIYDGNRETLTYVNAGHCPPFHISSADGRTDISLLKPTGMVLGVLPEAVYRQETIKIKGGDVLALFTDGLTECVNDDGGEFGEERLGSVIAKSMNESPRDIQRILFDELDKYRGDNPPHDDMTVVIARKL